MSCNSDLNSIIINNYYVVIDTFFSNKYNSFVVILNNRHNIKKYTNIDVSDIKYILNNEEITLTTPEIKDYIHLDTNNTNIKYTVFNKNFHIEILYKPNVNVSTKSNEIKIVIGNKIYNFNLSPPCIDFIENKCITTIFKDEYHLIDRWIEYHKKIGFEKFILYDNCSNSNNIPNKYVSNTEEVIIIKATWKYWDTDSFNNRSTIGQVIQQNHCLWKYCPKFLALTDLDEYINPHNNFNIFNDKVSVLSIPNYFFNAMDRNNFKLEDSLYRENKCCDGKYKEAQRKCIIYSQNVDLFCIHIPIQFQSIYYASFDEVQLNHYINLSSKLRNKNNYTQKDDTILLNL